LGGESRIPRVESLDRVCSRGEKKTAGRSWPQTFDRTRPMKVLRSRDDEDILTKGEGGKKNTLQRLEENWRMGLVGSYVAQP